MGLFGKKKEEPKQNMSSFDMPMQSPNLTEQVQTMKQQGYNSNQIVQSLQGQGFNPVEISDAMNQSNVSGNFQNQPPDMGMEEYGQQHYEPYQDQGMQFQQGQHDMPQQMGQSQNASVDEEKVQQIVEAVIDEKWEEFAKDVKKIIEWKEKTEDRMAKTEQQIMDMRMTVDSLTKSIMTKISSYDQNIMDVGTEIKAMEKVFQKVLPSLTENVNKLERMSKDRTVTKK